MPFLGVNAYGHDPAVAIVEGSEVLFFLEEERCCRVKHASGRFPTQALQEAMAFTRLRPSDIEAVAYPFARGAYFVNRALRHGLLRLRPRAFRKTAALSLRRMFLDRDIASTLGARLPPARFLDHHTCHAASAYYASGLSEAAVLTVDGAGEDATIAIYRGVGPRLEPRQRVRYPHSIGAFYSSIALYLGFSGGSPEGTMMGLAGHGEPTQIDFFRKVVRFDAGELTIDLDYFDYPGLKRGVSRRLIAELGPARDPGEPLNDRHRDVAASAQLRLEEVLLDLVRHALQTTGQSDLCLAGGVALNTVANARIADEAGVRRLYIVPVAHDAGAALGAAWLEASERRGFDLRPGPLLRASLGRLWDAEAIEELLTRHQIPHHRVDNLPVAVAEDLARSRVVGLFNGRDDAGPRALGNRSILADPRNPAMKDHLNQNVKHRETFRPFGPMVRLEDLPAYFENPRPSPFMLLTARANALAREKIPAALHVDGSARVQSVDRERSPLHWHILSELGVRTGVPIVINTSFNDRGEPLVHSPEDAYRCFRESPISVLYLGPFRIEQAPSLPALEPGAGARVDRRFHALES